MGRSCLVLVLVLNILPTAAMAFDGDRKGIVVGAGLGISPSASWTLGAERESWTGLGLQLAAGYAWCSRDAIMLEINGTSYSSSRYNTDSLIGTGSLLTTQTFTGPSLHHRFGSVGRSSFAAIGLGACTFDRGEPYERKLGPGFLIGGGFEFTRHLEVGIYYCSGRTSEATGADRDHHHLNLLISGWAY
jgi:hypothetical protein